jgi:hypothetical protein
MRRAQSGSCPRLRQLSVVQKSFSLSPVALFVIEKHHNKNRTFTIRECGGRPSLDQFSLAVYGAAINAAAPFASSLKHGP